MDKLLVICGPTATGKTQLAVQLAKKFHGEIVSADSRQVYRGMDIGTGKDLPVNSKLKFRNSKQGTGYYLFDGVAVWMLDVVGPTEQFSVAQYCKVATRVIDDVGGHGRLPIVVGGTGLYIKALIDGIDTIDIPPNEKLRRQLLEKSPEDLFNQLKWLDQQRAAWMNASDRKNPRRLVRAIEVAIHRKNKSGDSARHTRSAVMMIGLTAPRQVLYQRIDKRLDIRLQQGMVGEVERLLTVGVSHRRLQQFGLEYRVIDMYLGGELTKDEMTRRLKADVHAFARRQLTWFRKDRRIYWFDISQPQWREKVVSVVREWYNKSDAKD